MQLEQHDFVYIKIYYDFTLLINNTTTQSTAHDFDDIPSQSFCVFVWNDPGEMTATNILPSNPETKQNENNISQVSGLR